MFLQRKQEEFYFEIEGPISMGIFLTGNEVSRALHDIVAGHDLRCAVSFWKYSATVALRKAGTDINRTRIVCNISTGECTPEALLELGAPHNNNLRYHSNLSANVWVSDRGALVGAATPLDLATEKGRSKNGILEAATYHRANSSAWRAAAEWFDRLYNGARPLDVELLELARFKCSLKSRVSEWRQPQNGSLLDLVLDDPEIFNGVGFVITSRLTTEKERSSARQGATEAGVAPQDVIDAFPSDGIFLGRDRSDVLLWPRSFIELWLPNNVLKVFPRTVCTVDPDGGTIFTRRAPRLLAGLLPTASFDIHTAQRTDTARIHLLRDLGLGLFPTAIKFAQTISAL